MNKKEVVLKRRRRVLTYIEYILFSVGFVFIYLLAGSVETGRETPLVWILIWINFGFIVLAGLIRYLLYVTE